MRLIFLYMTLLVTPNISSKKPKSGFDIQHFSLEIINIKPTHHTIKSDIGYRICLNSRRFNCTNQNIKQCIRFSMSTLVKYSFYITCYWICISNYKTINECDYKGSLFEAFNQ